MIFCRHYYYEPDKTRVITAFKLFLKFLKKTLDK